MTNTQTSDSRPPEDPGPAPIEAPLGGAVSRGMSWMGAAAVAGRGVSFVQMWALGWLLFEEDFGVYAAVLGIWGLVAVLREGSVTNVLIRRGLKELPRLEGPGFWLCLTMNLGVGAILGAIALALPAARGSLSETYADPRLPSMLLVVALGIPLSTPAAILIMRLRMHMRFAELSRVQMVSAILRAVVAVGLASVGFGPISLVWPLTAVALWEWWALHRLTPLRLRDLRFNGPVVRSLFHQAIHALTVGLGNFFVDKGVYVVIPVFLGKAVVGVFSFGFEIMMQLAALISWNLQLVLMPALARLNAEKERQRAAVVRALRAVTVISCPMCMGLAAVMEPLEGVLWGGRWAGAVAVVQIFGAAFPARMTFGLTNAVLMAQGRFRTCGTLMLIEGVMLVGAGAAGAVVLGSAWGVAACVAGALVVARVGVTAYTVVTSGGSAREVTVAMAPAWLASIAAWALAAWAEALAFVDAGLGGAITDAFEGAGLGARWIAAGTGAARIAVIGPVFSASFV
ncbi:MAG: hypothetical protein FJ255_12480, partial [Phycisphaerae bacterium]|nr:hypothetical protein [Phycisphaerae bacterium]